MTRHGEKQEDLKNQPQVGHGEDVAHHDEDVRNGEALVIVVKRKASRR